MAGLLVGSLLATQAGGPEATATPVDVPVTCDLPAPTGVTGIYAATVPDTTAVVVPVDVAIAPAVAGEPVHETVSVPIPQLGGALPQSPAPGFTPSYGYFYVNTIDITQALPPGLDAGSVTVAAAPTHPWLQVAKVGTNVTVHVESPVHGSAIRLDLDAVPITTEIETSLGVWEPLAGTVTFTVDGQAVTSGATAISWHPPTVVLSVTYGYSFLPLLAINWAGATVTCTADNPNLVVASAPIAPRLHQPDAWVRRGTGPSVGDDTHNATGLNQGRSASVRPGHGVAYTVTAQNDGNITDGLRVRGPGSTSRFTVRYLRNGADITAAVTAGTYPINAMLPGQHPTIVMSVTARSTAPVGARLSGLVKLTSVGDGLQVDAVRTITTVT